jgi:hypothetical protein
VVVDSDTGTGDAAVGGVMSHLTRKQLDTWKREIPVHYLEEECGTEGVRRVEVLIDEVAWLQDRIKTMQGETLPPDEWFESVLSSLDDLNAWGERIGLGQWLENFEPEVRKAFVMLAEDAGDLIRGLLRRDEDPGLIAKVFTHQRFHDLHKHPGPPAAAIAGEWLPKGTLPARRGAFFWYYRVYDGTGFTAIGYIAKNGGILVDGKRPGDPPVRDYTEELRWWSVPILEPAKPPKEEDEPDA